MLQSGICNTAEAQLKKPTKKTKHSELIERD